MIDFIYETDGEVWEKEETCLAHFKSRPLAGGTWSDYWTHGKFPEMMYVVDKSKSEFSELLATKSFWAGWFIKKDGFVMLPMNDETPYVLAVFLAGLIRLAKEHKDTAKKIAEEYKKGVATFDELLILAHNCALSGQTMYTAPGSGHNSFFISSAMRGLTREEGGKYPNLQVIEDTLVDQPYPLGTVRSDDGYPKSLSRVLFAALDHLRSPVRIVKGNLDHNIKLLRGTI